MHDSGGVFTAAASRHNVTRSFSLVQSVMMISLTCVCAPFMLMVRVDSACLMKTNKLLNNFQIDCNGYNGYEEKYIYHLNCI